jgi:hypothetical protein
MPFSHPPFVSELFKLSLLAEPAAKGDEERVQARLR